MSRYESPDYTLLMQEKPFELRRYESFYIMEYANDQDPTIRNGFSTLFSYISSNNENSQKISMTVPVLEEMSEKGMKMAFVIPKSTISRIPRPNSPYLSAQLFEQGTFAVIRYSGKSNRQKESMMKRKLRKWIQSKGYKQQGRYFLAFYNPPFVPPVFRRNEIFVRVTSAK